MKIFNYSMRVLHGRNKPAHETPEGYVPLDHGEQYTLLLRNYSNMDALASVKIDSKKIAVVKVPANDSVKIDAPFNSDQKLTFYKKNSEEADDLGLGDLDKDDLGSVEVKFVAVEKEFQWKPVTINERIVYVPVYQYWYPWWAYHPTITVTPAIYYTNGTSSGLGSVSSSFTTTNLNHVTDGGSYSSINGASTSYTVNNATSTFNSVTLTCSNTGLGSGGTGLSGVADYVPHQTEKLSEEFEKYLDEETATTIFLRLVHKRESYKAYPAKLTGYSNKKPAPVD